MHCTHAAACGGCSTSAPYARQLTDKRAHLMALLGREVPPVAPSPRTEGFRQKAAFVFGTAPGSTRLVMGHYAAGSRRVIPVSECPVHSDRANRIAFALRDRLARANIPAADTRGGILRHLIIRTSDDDHEAVAMLIVTRNDKSLRAPVRGLLASPDAPDGFFVNINTRGGALMVGDETLKIAGRSHVRQRDVGGIDFLVSPDAFFQTNVDAARVLVAQVCGVVPANARVLDLYCGSGLFALPLVQRGARVTAVEENRTAIADLQANARLNRLPTSRLRAIAGRVEDVVSRLAETPWDVVILDPPRSGCAPAVLPAVCEGIAPPLLVYVSCEPTVLARDLQAMQACGYRVDGIQPVDMFPHTDHLETIAVLRRP
ncbi:MAG: 23S rRNA (uracil-5-)-methyltransferase RumA [Acidimicrobiia bacterium]